MDETTIEKQEWFSAVSTTKNGEWKVLEKKWLESVDDSPVSNHRTRGVRSGIRDVFLNNLNARKNEVNNLSTGEAICWGLGKRTLRSHTRIGGAPYVDQHFHWPRTKSGVPLQFYAQFRLSTVQQELLGRCGDLLLLFEDQSGEEDSVYSVTVTDSQCLATAPVSVAQCRENLAMPDTEFFGVLVDFLRPEIVDPESQTWRQSVRGGNSSVEIDFGYHRHLFTICSFQPHRDIWPYVNYREFPDVEKQPDFLGGFDIADMGSIVVTMDACLSLSASVVLGR